MKLKSERSSKRVNDCKEDVRITDQINSLKKVLNEIEKESSDSEKSI